MGGVGGSYCLDTAHEVRLLGAARHSGALSADRTLTPPYRQLGDIFVCNDVSYALRFTDQRNLISKVFFVSAIPFKMLASLSIIDQPQ